MKKNWVNIILGFLLFIIGISLSLYIGLVVGLATAFSGTSYGGLFFLLVTLFVPFKGLQIFFEGLGVESGVIRKENEDKKKYYLRIVGYLMLTFLLACFSKYLGILLYEKLTNGYFFPGLPDALFFLIGWFVYFVIFGKSWPRNKLIKYATINFLVLFLILPTLGTSVEYYLLTGKSLILTPHQKTQLIQDEQKAQSEKERIKSYFISNVGGLRVTPFDVSTQSSPEGNIFTTYTGGVQHCFTPSYGGEECNPYGLIYVTETSSKTFSSEEKNILLEKNLYDTAGTFTYVQPATTTIEIENQKLIFVTELGKNSTYERRYRQSGEGNVRWISGNKFILYSGDRNFNPYTDAIVKALLIKYPSSL